MAKKSDEFFQYIHEMIEYWDKTRDDPKDKMRGLIFCLFVAMDGHSGSYTPPGGQIDMMVGTRKMSPLIKGLYHEAWCKWDEKRKKNEV